MGGTRNPTSCAMCDLRKMGAMSSGTSSDEEYEEHNDSRSRGEKVGEAGWQISFLRIGSLRSCHLALDLCVSRNARGLVAAVLLPWLPTVAVF